MCACRCRQAFYGLSARRHRGIRPADPTDEDATTVIGWAELGDSYAPVIVPANAPLGFMGAEGLGPAVPK